MRKVPILILAGVVGTALAGVTAAASLPRTHVLTIRLPNGAVEQLHYTGNVAPRVFISSTPAPVRVLVPVPSTFLAVQSPFAAIDRLSAEMNREMAMLSSARPGGTMSTSFGQIRPAGLANLPAGARSYSIVSTFRGGQACMRSVEVTSEGVGKAPHVVSKTSGDCAAKSGPAIRAPMTAPGSPKNAV